MDARALTTFYLIRHGQTDWNNKHLLQGRSDIPLNATGEEQARELAQLLKDVNFDLAFSSDLLRTKRTAEIVVLEKNLYVETTKLLRERNFGTFEGQPVTTLLAYLKLLRGLNHEERANHRIAEGIENDNEVTTRLITFIRETAITHPGKNILAVTHSGILRMILLHTGYHTYEQSDAVYLANGSYIKLESDGIDIFIREVSGIFPRAAQES